MRSSMSLRSVSELSEPEPEDPPRDRERLEQLEEDTELLRTRRFLVTGLLGVCEPEEEAEEDGEEEAWRGGLDGGGGCCLFSAAALFSE